MAPGEFWRKDRHGAARQMFSENPEVSSYSPTSDALAKAKEQGDKSIIAAIERCVSLPQSTKILANPPLHEVQVDCNGFPVTLQVRSFGIRGILSESDIVSGRAGPLDVIFIGLFGRRPTTSPIDETKTLGAFLDRKFMEAVGQRKAAIKRSLVDRVAGFVLENPGLGPELTMQFCAAIRKGSYAGKQLQERGINDSRKSGALLLELLATHMQNVAAGALSIYANKLRRDNPAIARATLVTQVTAFVKSEADQGKNAFQVAYSLLLGRSASSVESGILERMGVIQTHHGSAGSNMAARYLTTLHCLSVSDFFTGSQMVMDGERHFGAIHDMTNFIERLELMPEAKRDAAIRASVLEGGLPTFGHPEIAAAGRGGSIEKDPRAAIYLAPVFDALDAGQLELSQTQRARLALIQRIYRLAFVEGVVKPGREGAPPLRLTPNTDFGAWSVQESLGIYGASRTFLTYIFRGFGWMMDCREQLKQKIIRPVIAADPSIIPTDRTDPTIPAVVTRLHERLARPGEAFARAK